MLFVNTGFKIVAVKNINRNELKIDYTIDPIHLGQGFGAKRFVDVNFNIKIIEVDKTFKRSSRCYLSNNYMNFRIA